MALRLVESDRWPVEDIGAQYGEPLDRLTATYDNMQRQLAGAKAAGNHHEAQYLRKLLQQTKTILNQYGADR